MSKYSADYFIKLIDEGVEEENMVLTAQMNPIGNPPTGDVWEWLDDDEQDALYELILPYGMMIHVNDGVGMWRNVAPTPKQRVLAFLNFIKKSKQHIA